MSTTQPYLPGAFEDSHAERQFLLEREQAQARADRRRRESRRLIRRPETREALGIFLLFFAAYTALGWYTTVHLLAAPFDSVSRLAHISFFLHGDPGKLAAIGFVWPPLITLMLLPFGAVEALATSLWALPLSSAFCAGGMFAVLNRTFDMLGMPRVARYALLLAFAFNPFLARYSSNGMGEILSLFLLVVGMHYFMKWMLSQRDSPEHPRDWYLAPCGLAWSLAALSRYEIALNAFIIAGAIGIILRRRRAGGNRTEGTLLLYVAPVVYCLALWVFFNFLITGDALYFLNEQVRQRFEEYKKTPYTSISEPVRLVLEMNLKLFLPTLIVLPALLVVAAIKRNLFGVLLAGLLALNPAVTLAAMIRANDLALVQPRFNVRSLPMAMIAVGWLWHVLHPGWQRQSVVVLTVLATIVGYPLCWKLMDTFPYQDQRQEARFIEALKTGDSQSTPDLDIPAANRMADFVGQNVTGEHTILIDDSQGFAPMLVGTDVPKYFDRIYKGDTDWYKVRDDPRGKVRWMMITAAKEDLVRRKWTGREPWLRKVRTEGKYVLYAVAPPARR